MPFQSANSNVLVEQEPAIKKQDIPVNAIPVFAADRKMINSGVLVTSLATQESSIINALIFG